MSDLPDNQNTESTDPDDFANFDPEAYLRKHRDTEGRHYRNEDLARNEELVEHGRGRRRARGRRSDEDDDEIYNMEPGAALGFGERLLGPLTRGEGIFLWSDVLREFGPIIGRFLPLIGCVVLL